MLWHLMAEQSPAEEGLLGLEDCRKSIDSPHPNVHRFRAIQTNTYNKPYASIELHSKDKRKGQVTPMMFHPNGVIPAASWTTTLYYIQ